MGCTGSKLDDLPAVALCRERCSFLDEAIHQRYAFAEAHIAYIHSLKVVGSSLQRFFDRDLDSYTASPPSPILNLPNQRKGDPQPSNLPPPAAAAAAVRHSHSNSGSHLQFHSDSDDDDSGSESSLHLHSDAVSPVHPYGQVNYVDETMDSYPGGGFMHMNYMKKQAPPSVSYEQRPMSPETVHMGGSSSYYPPYPYSNQNPSTSYSYDNYPNYGGYFGSSPPQQQYGSSYPPPQQYGSSYPPPQQYGSPPQQYGSSAYPPPQQYGSAYPPPPVGSSSTASSSKPPPPPPSPPRGSTWDFLNPFETFEKYYPPYTPSRDSREVREEEGIPDLEDEDYQQEVVKEVDQKFVNGDGGGGGGNYSKSKAVVDDEEVKADVSESLYHTRPSVSMENHTMEYEVHMVDKKVVDKDESSGDRGKAAGSKARGDLGGDSEVVREIQVQFERASESGNELAKMLEVGKISHNRKHAAYQASKMLHVITPSLSMVSSLPSTSKPAESSSIDKANPAYLDIDELGLRSRTLSSTLQRLYLWEKKLYEEVKVEEKMRILHERKCRKLKRLDERGAEAHKVDVTRILVRSLSTKIRVAIQVVDKISVKINKMRDEEFWPQLNELIQGLTRMWKSMLECHRSQCHAIGEARRLDVVASHKHRSDAHLEVTSQLVHELLNWTFRFSCWVSAHKAYVRALNNWLLKCLIYEPEETPDGIAPFSPGRIGAPPVFGVCNQWAQALDRISEKEVVDSMRDFAASVLHLWERDKLEMRQKMMGNKDTETKVKNLEREDQKIHKEIQAIDKRIILVSGDGKSLSVAGQAVYQSDTSKNSSLQMSLQHLFEAMERFTANNLKAYEELLHRIEEDRRAQEQEKVS